MNSIDKFSCTIEDGTEVAERSKKDTIIVMLIVLIITVLLSNIIIYQIMNAKMNALVKKSEQEQYTRYSRLIQDEILAAKTDVLFSKSELTKQIDILESKYYFLESMMSNAERRGYLVIQK